MEDTTLNVEFNGTYRTWYYERFNFTTANTLLIRKNPNATIPSAASNQITIGNQTAGQQVGVAIPISSENASAGNGEQAGTVPQSSPTQTDNIFTKIINWFKRLLGGK
jgi:hypothetical protein